MTYISFKNVSKSFPEGLKKKTVLQNLSLDVEKGEVFGFLGPNGAGKSTAIKLLIGFIKADNGYIKVNDYLVGKEPSYLRYIGYLPETPCFYENLTAMETLSFCGKSHGMTGPDVKDKSCKILERLNLSHAAKSRIKTFSKGMKQRLGLAAAILHDPEIFILDEPMSGLDPMGRHLVTDVILELREKGKTVFFSSHILSDVEKLCDRISILNNGHLLFAGIIADLIQEGKTLEDSFINFIQQDNRIKNE